MTAEGDGTGGRKVRDGTVVSDKMEKTIVVASRPTSATRCTRRRSDACAGSWRTTSATRRNLGDRVRIVEASPISRRKRWRVVEVLERAELPEVAPESIDLELLGEVKPEEPEVEEAAAERAGSGGRARL